MDGVLQRRNLVYCASTRYLFFLKIAINVNLMLYFCPIHLFKSYGIMWGGIYNFGREWFYGFCSNEVDKCMIDFIYIEC